MTDVLLRGGVRDIDTQYRDARMRTEREDSHLQPRRWVSEETSLAHPCISDFWLPGCENINACFITGSVYGTGSNSPRKLIL